MEIRAKGLCLRTTEYGDSDKLCAIYLLGEGKVTVKFKGVKKPKAKLAFAAAPLCLGEYIINERMGYYTGINCTLITSFMPLWNDLPKFYTSLSALELLDKCTSEMQLNDELAIIVIDYLRGLTLSDEPISYYIEFLYKFAVMSGYGFSLKRASENGVEISGNVGKLLAAITDSEEIRKYSKSVQIQAVIALTQYLSRIVDIKLKVGQQCIEFLLTLADENDK